MRKNRIAGRARMGDDSLHEQQNRGCAQGGQAPRRFGHRCRSCLAAAAAPRSDATFFYAVTTTGVFCRPSCASRRPLRANVRFFRTAAEAQAAGFRPCKRCRPGTTAWSSPLDKIRMHIEANLDRPVRLEELGRVAGLSPFTVQRLFKREMGVSPLALPARAQSRLAAQGAQARRHRDQRNL